MIQFNLLPDIKIQYLRAKRQQHLVILASTVAVIAALSLFVVLMLVVHVLQKKNLSDLNADIKDYSTELKNTPDLTKILTVQNQLKSLPSLHDKKIVGSRLFKYISQVTPSQASITRTTADFAANVITISGKTDKLTTVNTYVDTLKFTTYKLKDDTGEGTKAFSEVVLTSFSRDNTNASYTITFKFDPIIFSQTSDVTLTVPKIITTRSQIEQPSALFQSSGEE